MKVRWDFQSMKGGTASAAIRKRSNATDSAVRRPLVPLSRA